MAGRFEGKVALVTGAASGIGAASARRFAAEGARVMLGDIDGAGLAVVAAQIDGSGETVGTHAADVSDRAQVEALTAAAVERFGRLDIMVPNAGLQQDASLTEMTLKQWQTVIDVNLTGQFLCCRAAVRAFKRQGVDPSISVAAGKIICMSSVHEVIPWAGHVNYAASKGGVMMMMKTIAQEVAPDRIRVNAIGPGAIRTGINRPAWETPEAYSDLMELVPYKRIGEPEDIARAAVWLASDASDYVTGITLLVDGGMCLYPGFADGG